MIRVIEAQASDDAQLLPGQRREQLFDGEDMLGYLRRGIECGAGDLIRFDWLTFCKCQPDCTP